MLRPFARLRHDPAGRYLATAVLTAVAVEIALRLVTLTRLASIAGVRIQLSSPGGECAELTAALGSADAARLRAARIVMRRWPFGARGHCLREALVAGRMLRHHRPRLALGARSDERGARAHAWLLVDGVALDPDTARWTPLLTPGAR